MRRRIGRNDVAYRLLLQTSFPSWGFCIANGATSIWERWDSWTPDKARGLCQNHATGCAVGSCSA
jgi:hypothetical protein